MEVIKFNITNGVEVSALVELVDGCIVFNKDNVPDGCDGFYYGQTFFIIEDSDVRDGMVYKCF